MVPAEQEDILPLDTRKNSKKVSGTKCPVFSSKLHVSKQHPILMLQHRVRLFLADNISERLDWKEI